MVDGKVTITLAALNGARLQSVAESVKIQGYETAPSGNPPPGLFTTYKGNETTVIVDAYAYYCILRNSLRRAACCGLYGVMRYVLKHYIYAVYKHLEKYLFYF